MWNYFSCIEQNKLKCLILICIVFLSSPHVVKYYGSYFKNTDLWIVMEYCGAGSVSDIIRLRNKTVRLPPKRGCWASIFAIFCQAFYSHAASPPREMTVRCFLFLGSLLLFLLLLPTSKTESQYGPLLLILLILLLQPKCLDRRTLAPCSVLS